MSAHADLLVYLHIPFCRSKCHFCDWVTEVPTSELLLRETDQPRIRHLDALCWEIAERGGALGEQGYTPSIQYWGGGTASILTTDEIARLGAALREVFTFRDLQESTIECSPDSLSPAKLAAFRDAGFTRLSSGVQSFDPARLRTLGRSHDAGQARTAVRWAAEAGFDDISIDLICGFPGQSAHEVAESVRAALDLPITHVALYPYRPAHGTVMRRQLGRGGRTIDRDEQRRGYAAGAELLVGAGFPEYAMSHFGSRQCFSDLTYFQLRSDWAGFGSGATSVVGGRYLSHARGRLLDYNRDPLSFEEDYELSSAAIAPRLLYQSLTTFEGAERARWQARTGRDFDEIMAEPACRSLLEFFESVTTVVRDERGIRLPSTEIADAFIDLQYLNAPKQGRAQLSATAAALMG
ncbi:oxygen-independent coproporphyrinogen-3 oxidase [Amycolatopsis lexingtonensis]|uniref:Heme chaperone HemW n=1 Tax=Amycolatopsis lexingtonensis TaxID=218822 RepID=A0ABR9HQI9_9PSEU|nr:coproporphyrinogen-III oxidase family protein [Amycolatopsis lexingtonensis]MBE1493145.1 oxygen-independent coproporphyrinogen-3 oxidase [Amycolatopsis lexingtonensis]